MKTILYSAAIIFTSIIAIIDTFKNICLGVPYIALWIILILILPIIKNSTWIVKFMDGWGDEIDYYLTKCVWEAYTDKSNYKTFKYKEWTEE